ncbi:hypothetical protein C8T65DRAFT_639237 [Cerioporus squamosus]|nr:hypothetical protein C8T65DRAFT_639237 [Cerioporus squamosus]
MLVRTGILINTLFDRYFFPKFRGAPPADPEPVFDCLLQVVDSDRSQGLPSVLRTGGGLDAIILLCASLSPDRDDRSSCILFALQFLAHLKNIWDAKKEQRLAAECVSPMPWSVSSRRLEDQPFVLVHFARMQPDTVFELACRESGIPRSSADFIHIPPMRWLGATHDGHPAFVSVHAYVLARYKSAQSLLDHVALWQSALTFGVLEAITGLIIPESWFLSTRDDGTVLFTSHHISSLVFTFGLRLYLEPNDARRRLLADHAFSTIEWACKALCEELIFPSSHRHSFFWSTGISDSEVDDIVCSIYALLAVFRLALSSVMQQKTVETGESPLGRRYNLPDVYQDIVGRVHQSYTRRMLETGWCPYTLAKLRKTDSESAVILGILGMERPSVRHRPDEHAACTEESCTVHNVDPATYTTHHTTPTCSCPFLAPTFSGVDAMLSVGEIPVMTYEGDRLSTRRAADGPYVAISHVWADGLGSTTEKGLPTCQVSRISAFARQLVPDGAFWIDGLCVPEAKHLRKSAIRLMARTYRGADQVVVLDAGIRSHCSLSRTPAENILRVKTSVWMQRIWTMHEAFLARELYFEFSDGLVAGSSIRRGLERSGLPGHYSWWWIVMNVFLDTTLLDPAAGESERRRRFTDVARRIAFCTTSKPEDAAVAVAGMLDMDVSKLLDEPDVDARMRTLLLEMRTLSVDIMFRRPLTAHEAERLPYPGFRWAPRNVTVINWYGGMSGGGSAICSPEGLTTEDTFPVVFLTEKFCHRSEMGYDGEGLLFVFDLLQGGRFLIVKPTPTSVRPFDSFEAHEFNALVVRVRDARTGQERDNMQRNAAGAEDSIFPVVHQSVDVLAVHVPDPARILESDSPDTTPVVCEYRFMTELWQPPVLQGSTPEGLAQNFSPDTSYLCASGRMIRARITLT